MDARHAGALSLLFGLTAQARPAPQEPGTQVGRGATDGTHAQRETAQRDRRGEGREQTLRLDWPVDSSVSLRGEVWGLLLRRDGFGVDKTVVWGKAELGTGASEAGGGRGGRPL